jgi:hypothetical protein
MGQKSGGRGRKTAKGRTVTAELGVSTAVASFRFMMMR